MDTNINIIFSNQQGGGSEADPTTPGSTPNPEAPEKQKQDGKTDNKALTMAKAMAVQIGKQAMQMVTSRVGIATRSTLKQQQMNAAMKTAGYGIGFVGALATQNYAAAAMMVVSAGFEMANSVMDYNYNIGIEKQTLSINNVRAGINRSR